MKQVLGLASEVGGVEAVVVIGKLHHGLGHLDSLPQLPVGFPIELVCFEKEGALVVVGVEDDNIGGHPVSALNLNDVAND